MAFYIYIYIYAPKRLDYAAPFFRNHDNLQKALCFSWGTGKIKMTRNCFARSITVIVMSVDERDILAILMFNPWFEESFRRMLVVMPSRLFKSVEFFSKTASSSEYCRVRLIVLISANTEILERPTEAGTTAFLNFFFFTKSTPNLTDRFRTIQQHCRIN